MSAAKRVGILGAHGQIARLLTRTLTTGGHTVRGIVRSEDQFGDLRDDGAEPVLCDLEAADGDELDAALRDSEVVVFAAGAGPGSSKGRKKSLDRDGAIAGVESAARIGAGRFVIISSMGADDPPDDDETFSVYLQAKHDADNAVQTVAAGNDLSFTIVRPGKLTDDDPTGAVQLADHVDRSEITRSDVAEVLAALISTDRGHDRTFEVVNGDTEIAAAIAAHSIDRSSDDVHPPRPPRPVRGHTARRTESRDP